jgi:hypothetical protein
MALDPDHTIHVPWAVGCSMDRFGSSVMSDSNGGDRDGPRNFGHFNQLMWLIAQQISSTLATVKASEVM